MKVLLSIALVLCVLTTEALSECIQEPVQNNNTDGGYQDIPVGFTVNKIAGEATNQWNSNENVKENYFRATCIRKARRQINPVVIDRSRYYTVIIKISISETECLLSDIPNLLDTEKGLNACQLKKGGQTMNCEFTVVSNLIGTTVRLKKSVCQVESINQGSVNLDAEREVDENTGDDTEDQSGEESNEDKEDSDDEDS